MKNLKQLLLTIAALALGFTFLTPAAPAQAYHHVYFHIINKDTGKCLQWNGYHKNIIEATCKNKDTQWWAAEQAKVCSYANELGGWCLGYSGREKPMYGRGYSEAPQLIYSSLRNNAQTTIGAAQCGYFKAVSGKLLCGSRISGPHGRGWSPKMTWVIKY